MKLRFWGVRGSIPTPSPDTVAFGGNTSCVSVDFGNHLVIFDAGTGIRPLGNAVLTRATPPKLHLFLSHLHWDHIQGFPFFAPAYRSGYSMDVYGRGNADRTLGSILAGQMEGPNFPVSLNQLGAALSYQDINPGAAIDLGGSERFAVMRCVQGNHPNGVLVYRLESAAGQSIVYATDTEHLPGGPDEGICSLARGADLLIYDGMYTPDEYEALHKGWGHSTWEKGFELACAAGVKAFVVFHHDPSHDDAYLSELEKKVQAHCRSIAPQMKVLFAREGLEVEL